MSLIRTLFVSFALLLVAVPSYAQSKSNNNQQVIMGWVEYIYLQDLDGRLKGKLDTGATTSSMRAEVVKVMEAKKKDQSDSIVFQIVDADGKTTTLQRNLVRWVRIKGKSGGHQRRPVVEMDFCIAGHAVRSEVNLAPRADFIYPILVGRNMLRDANIIVDPARTYTSRAHCPNISEAE